MSHTEEDVTAEMSLQIDGDGTGDDVLDTLLKDLIKIKSRMAKAVIQTELLSKLEMRFKQALVLVQFLRQCDEVMFWINEFGHDLEHVEVLQRKFDEFQKDMASQEFLVTDVCETADKLVSDQHPESSVVTDKKAELLEAWARLRLRLLIII